MKPPQDKSLPVSISPLWNRIPSEVEFPVEASPSHVTSGDILECLVADDVDNWTDHSLFIGFDLGQKGLQPTWEA